MKIHHRCQEYVRLNSFRMRRIQLVPATSQSRIPHRSAETSFLKLIDLELFTICFLFVKFWSIFANILYFACQTSVINVCNDIYKET